MGNRYSGVGGSRHTCRDPGDDLERNPGRDKGLGLLATATEDEWIASLEANDALAGSGALDHQLLDFTLGDLGRTRTLSDVDELGIRSHTRQGGGWDQPVVENDVGGGDQLGGPDRAAGRGRPGPAPTR